MAELSILDPAVWASLRALDDDPSFVDELIDLFVEHAVPHAAQLRSSLLVGDMDAAHRAAHSLRGSAGNIGASTVAALARLIEHDLADGRPVAIERADELSGALQQAVEALLRQRARPCG